MTGYNCAEDKQHLICREESNRLKENLRLKRSVLSSAAYKIAALVCSFILPRMILQVYGSAQNGVVNSISQFLSVFGFLDLGVGAVVESSLYLPLVQRNFDKVSEIIAAANNFFRKLAFLLCLYVAGLAVFYPTVVKNVMPPMGVASLVVAMSLTSFAQYYFGMVDLLLLSADQRKYISDLINLVTLLINTVVGVLLIVWGFPIQAVQIAMAVIYLSRPVFLRLYVRRHYAVNRKASFTKNSIPQKWNGMSQHIAYTVLQNTDVVVLTLFSTMESVSIYTVYLLVMNGIKSALDVITAGVGGRMGQLWAQERTEDLNEFFRVLEWAIHMIAAVLFGCVSALIVPFVLVYTKGVHDADYNQVQFAMLLSAAYFVANLRTPYNLMVKACGHYKETERYYALSAGVNIVISVLMVRWRGLIGVTIGTFIAMLYQTAGLAHYCKQHLPAQNPNRWKLVVTDILIFCSISILGRNLALEALNYFAWIKLGILVFAATLLLAVVVCALCFRWEAKRFWKILRN